MNTSNHMHNLFQFGGRAAAAAGLVLALGTGAASACSLQNWSSTTGSIVANQPDGTAGDPGGDATNVARYAGLCGAAALSGAVAYAQDDRPGGIDRIIARFYVLDNALGNVQVYQGNDSGGTELFDVVVDGGSVTFASGGASLVAPIVAGNWNAIEVDWASGGNISLIVNDSAPITDSGAATGSLANTRLGNVNGGTATPPSVTVDAYEAHLSTPVGTLLNSDANNDTNINSADITTVVNEVFGGTLATGTPDCNESGEVNSADITCVVNLVF
jgi:hypothetical protein